MKSTGIKNILNEVRMSLCSNKQRKAVSTSHKSSKLGSIQKGTPWRPPQSRMHYRTISSSSKPYEAVSKGIRTSAVCKVPPQPPSTPYNLAKGMNDNFLFLRRENHLNTHFNIRKNKLKEITQTNKQIYCRLNSQKSFYSSKDLSKSYQSVREIKQRLSQSKVSRRLNSSRSSQKSLNSKVKSRQRKKVQLEIKAKDINKVDNDVISHFKGLFIRDTNVADQVKKGCDKEISHQNSCRKKNYQIKSRASARVAPVATSGQGGILHRVAEIFEEEEKGGKENRAKRNSLVLQNRKIFNF